MARRARRSSPGLDLGLVFGSILGAIGLFIYLSVLDRMLMMGFEFLLYQVSHGIDNPKLLEDPHRRPQILSDLKDYQKGGCNE